MSTSATAPPTAGIRPGTADPWLTRWPAAGTTTAVVLLLHGGKATSHEPATARQLTAVRLHPFAHAIARRGAAEGTAAWLLHYRERGWNGAEATPVADARWALAQIRATHGEVPVILLGHSMGGRTALRVADDPAVRAVLALAPWLPEGEPVADLAGRPVRILHGTRDRWVSPAGSLAWATRARAAGYDVTRTEVARSGHFLLRRARLWQALATYQVGVWSADRTAFAGPANDSAQAGTRQLV